LKEPCLILDCEKPRHGRGFCKHHYSKLKRKGFIHSPEEYKILTTIIRTCNIDDCNKIHFGKGYCKKHYGRYYRYGSPNIVKKKGYPKSKCKIDECERWCHGQGYCMNHYLKFSNPRNLEHDDLFMFIAKYNVRIKYNHKCQWYNCNRTPLDMEIHVHHIFPKNEYPELKYIEEYMITYCKEHHSYWHKMRGDYYYKLIYHSNGEVQYVK
jgi:hypothetical protein